MSVEVAIRAAEALLPGEPADDGDVDPRWQAIIAVGEFIETEPEAVWRFIARWGGHEQEDVRTAVSTCLLEHLLDHDCERYFPPVEALAREDARFAQTFCMCWRFGSAEQSTNRARWERLAAELEERHRH